MLIDRIPIALVFIGTIVLVAVSIEIGYQIGLFAHRRSEDEKESPVGAMMGAVLGLTAFMLAFTFGIVTDRYDARKGLLRDEANAIRTAFQRAEFLPEPDRSEAKGILYEYVDLRLTAAQATDFNAEVVENLLTNADQMQRRLWEMAVANARKDMNSDVAALYIESINELTEIHATRVTVALQTRIPTPIWAVLLALAMFGMMGVGYQTGIAGSRRSWARPILALSFSMVVTLIAALDRPDTLYLKISQQPLINVRNAIASQTENADSPEKTTIDTATETPAEFTPSEN